MSNIDKNLLWVDKYSPNTIEECILSKKNKEIFLGIVKNKIIPNMIFAGSPGTGKTTMAVLLCKLLGCDYKIINASNNRNIDLVRVDIEEYATSQSLENPGRKIMILDEADNLNQSSTQMALRNQIEKYADYCGFILTCNYEYKIIDALRSRCDVVNFKIEKNESKVLFGEFVRRLKYILDTEKVEHSLPVLVEIASKIFPDFRKTINRIQIYANANGKIDEGFLGNNLDEYIKELQSYLKDKNFNKIREWCVNNSGGDFQVLCRSIFNNADSFFKANNDIAEYIILSQKYQYENAFSIDKEIHILAFVMEIMATCEIK